MNGRNKIIKVTPGNMETESIESGVVGYIDMQGYPLPWNPNEVFPDYLLMQGVAAYLDKEKFDEDAAEAMTKMEGRLASAPGADEGRQARTPRAATTK